MSSLSVLLVAIGAFGLGGLCVPKEQFDSAVGSELKATTASDSDDTFGSDLFDSIDWDVDDVSYTMSGVDVLLLPIVETHLPSFDGSYQDKGLSDVSNASTTRRNGYVFTGEN